MTTTDQTSPVQPMHRNGKAMALALRLAEAENALNALTAGQVDAIIDSTGKTYLMRPAQEYLWQSERRIRTVIESAADVITVVSRGGAILSQSQAVNRVLGYEAEELVGHSLFKLIHEEDLQRLYSTFFNVVEGFHESLMAQFRHRTRDGSFRLIEATVGKLHDGSESVVLSLRPITIPVSTGTETIRLPERAGAVRYEAPCAEASLANHRFLAMLSHELRTPLAPVLLGVNLLQQDERFVEARSTLTMIRRNIELQSRLLAELSDFITVGQNKARLKIESIDVHEAVRFVLEICQLEIAAAQIEVRLDLRASQSIVRADSARLQQVMWNLVKNAIKFSTPGSSIVVTSANNETDGVTLEFIDHGIGIDSELLPLVFDPFRQGEYSMQHFAGSLGLGLFISKRLAEAQGGTLTVASEGHGHGTTFRLNFKTGPATMEHAQ